MTTTEEITNEVIAEVLAEIERGRQRFGEGSMSGLEMTDLERYAVMMEEAGEVAEALVLRIADAKYRPGRDHHADDLRTELVQLAACAVGYVVSIDRRAGLRAERGQ